MFVTVGDLTLHADRQGPADAPALVLLHSLGTTLHLWDPQMAALRSRYRVVRLDMRGHGLSEGPQGPYSLDDLSDDVIAAVDALGVGSFFVAGVSVGGMIAQHLAAHHPRRVRGIVVVDSSMVTALPAMWHERAAAVRREGLGPQVEQIVSRWVTPAFAADPATQGLRTMLARTTVEGFAGCAEAIAGADLRDSAANVACPALILVGDQDLSTPWQMADDMAAALRGTLRVIPGAAHIPNPERPAELAEMMLTFLDQVSRPLALERGIAQ